MNYQTRQALADAAQFCEETAAKAQAMKKDLDDLLKRHGHLAGRLNMLLEMSKSADKGG